MGKCEITLPTDSLVGQRHTCHKLTSANDDGTMNDLAFEFAGMDRLKLVAVVAKLEETVPEYRKRVHSVGHWGNVQVSCG